jgi:hypothetical protein
MLFKSCTFLPLVLLCLYLPRALAQGNLVLNGAFDTDATAWITNTWSGYYEHLKGNPGGCFTLTSLTTNLSTISQNVNGLVPGSNYAISGSYSVEGGNLGSVPSLGVAVNGVFVIQIAPPDYTWRSFVFGYRATSPSAILSLTAPLNGTSISYRIDNVVMQPIPSLTLRTGGTNVVVLWPTNTLGFNLQSATNLNAASWASITNTPVVDGTNYSVGFSVARQVQFFRLKR